jgi:RNA polymerase sigma-B factor
LSSQREAEQRLLRHYHSSGDPRAREAAIERFMPLARSLARRYRGSSEPLDDLEQVACLALVKAVDGFDPTRGTAFSSYAVPCIAGAIKRHFRDSGWSVRVPRDLQELALRVERINDHIYSETGEPPNPSEIALRAGVGVEAVLEAREAFKALRSDSLDQPRGSRDSDDAESLLDTLGSPDDELGLAFERAALDALLDSLEPRERHIVTLYYRGDLTQAEIGQQLGYSQMHVSRLLRGAVEHLRAVAAAEESARAPMLV